MPLVSKLRFPHSPHAAELPWINVLCNALRPCIGLLASLCWVCGAHSTAQGKPLSCDAPVNRDARVDGEDMRTGLLNSETVVTESSSHPSQFGAMQPQPSMLIAAGAPAQRESPTRVGANLMEATSPELANSSELPSGVADYLAFQSSPLSSPENLHVPKPKAGWLFKEGHFSKRWKRRWCVVENGLFQYFESFDSPNDKVLGLIPLQGAIIRDPKTARKRSSLSGPTVGPAWRLDTAAHKRDTFHQKYILAGDNAASSQAWRVAMEVHIKFANDVTLSRGIQ